MYKGLDMISKEKYTKALWDFDQLDELDQDRIKIFSGGFYERSSQNRSKTESEDVLSRRTVHTSCECSQ